MKININKKISLKKGLLVIPIPAEGRDYPKKSFAKQNTLYPTAVKNFIEAAIKHDKFKANLGNAISTHLYNKNLPRRLLVIGIGKKQNFKSSKARVLGAKISKNVRQLKVDEVSVMITPELEKFIEEFVEGLILTQYDLGKFKTKKKNKHEVERMDLITVNSSEEFKKAVDKAELISKAVDFAKDLVNSPSNIVDSEYMMREAKKIAEENKYKITTLNKKDLEKAGWGGLLAVNQGSAKEPKCITLEYYGAHDAKEKPVVIIGKGVMFDTGGYNLKPINHIETMHQDMAGAASVLGLFKILKKLNIKKNVIGIMPIVENMVGSKAYRPSDIIKMLSGQTVEITNTDAEGRLILADAITYGKKFNPQCVLTIATLTGAVIVALGDRYAGIMGNNPNLRKALIKAGKQVDELVWPLPIHADYKKKMDSLVADMTNCDLPTSRMAGSSKGGAFLDRFFGKNKWCHIDIGGTGFINDPQEYQTKGATAYGVRLFTRFLENL